MIQDFGRWWRPAVAGVAVVVLCRGSLAEESRPAPVALSPAEEMTRERLREAIDTGEHFVWDFDAKIER